MNQANKCVKSARFDYPHAFWKHFLYTTHLHKHSTASLIYSTIQTRRPLPHYSHTPWQTQHSLFNIQYYTNETSQTTTASYTNKHYCIKKFMFCRLRKQFANQDSIIGLTTRGRQLSVIYRDSVRDIWMCMRQDCE
jgi:hypothetical protein